MSAAARALGVDDEHLKRMNALLDELERANDAVGLTRVRHAVNERVVEARLLLRDGHIKNLNRLGERRLANWEDYR